MQSLVTLIKEVKNSLFTGVIAKKDRLCTIYEFYTLYIIANKVCVIALIQHLTVILESINLSSLLHLKNSIVPIVHHTKVDICMIS